MTVPADLPFPMTYRVDMETSDVSNLSVSDSQSFLALPSDAAIGLASDAVGKAGTPMAIRRDRQRTRMGNRLEDAASICNCRR